MGKRTWRMRTKPQERVVQALEKGATLIWNRHDDKWNICGAGENFEVHLYTVQSLQRNKFLRYESLTYTLADDLREAEEMKSE